MTIPGMSSHGLPPNRDWLVRWIKQIEAKVDRNAHARTLEHSSIADGGVSIVDGGGIVVIDPTTGNATFATGFAPIPDGSGRTQMITVLQRDDGSTALYCGDAGVVPGHKHQQALQWFDRAGNIVFADDTLSGHGVATPYIPAGQMVDITAPAATTTSASWTPLQWADAYVQHPKITAGLLVMADAGTAGQVRLTVSGAQVGAPADIDTGAFTTTYIAPAPWPSWDFQDRPIVQLEARVTSGSGSVGARCLGLWGVQS